MRVSVEKFRTQDGKGWGVRALEEIPIGTAVLVYEGELLVGKRTIEKREEKYENSPLGDDMGFMLWFRWNDKQYAIDATNSDGVSRFVNHSKKKANIKPQLKIVKPGNKPIVVLKATKTIAPQQELLFDYGDTRPEIVRKYPWLKF